MWDGAGSSDPVRLASIGRRCYRGHVKIVKYAAIVLVAYVALVVAFETYLGIAQPRFEMHPGEEWGETIVITTTGKDGEAQGRVVTPMVSDGQLHVSANHWPRSWYKRVLANPDVQVTNKGQTKDYRALPIAAGSDDHERLQREHPHSFFFRFLTGFPPRRFVRLEPR
jgi:hypothetical protein